MIYTYYFEDNCYRFEPTEEQFEDGLKSIIESKTSDEMKSDLIDIVESECKDLEEYYYEDFCEYFEDIAKEDYEEALQDKKSDDSIWSSYNDQRL